MIVRLIHEAEIEFWSSVEYYESREPGLGVRFEREIDRCLDLIAQQPLLPRLRRKAYRRINLAVAPHPGEKTVSSRGPVVLWSVVSGPWSRFILPTLSTNTPTIRSLHAGTGASFQSRLAGEWD